MRAAIIDRHGPPEAIGVRQVPVPEPEPDEALVRVSYGSVNHVDTFVRSGAWKTPMIFPFTVGRDAVGLVVKCGAEALGTFCVGDRVWTNSLGHNNRNGALAEYVSVPRSRIYRCPIEITSAQMAALCHPATTAWLALFGHGWLQPGQRVLVVGGGGNVGWSAVNLGVAAGSEVVASADIADHASLRAAGATPILSKQPVSSSVLGGPVDVVVDTAGCNDLASYVQCLNRVGRIVVLAGLDTTAVLPVGQLYLRGATITGFTISYASEDELSQAADGVNHAISYGNLRPRRVSLVPLADVADAHRRLEAGDIRGKVVVDIGGSSGIA